jgi:hypothetical protein
MPPKDLPTRSRASVPNVAALFVPDHELQVEERDLMPEGRESRCYGTRTQLEQAATP